MPNGVPENNATDFDFGVIVGMLIVVLLFCYHTSYTLLPDSMDEPSIM